MARLRFSAFGISSDHQYTAAFHSSELPLCLFDVFGGLKWPYCFCHKLVQSINPTLKIAKGEAAKLGFHKTTIWIDSDDLY